MLSMSDPSIFMGDDARINSELLTLGRLSNSYDYKKAEDVAFKSKPEKYREYCEDLMKKDLAAFESKAKKNAICAKTYQIAKFDIEYGYLSSMMEYNWRYEGGYKRKNKITDDNRDVDIKIEPLKAEYYKFLNNQNANNPLAVISSSYDSYINRVKFLGILRGEGLNLTTTDIETELVKSGYKLTESEQFLIKNAAVVDSFNKLKEVVAEQEKFKTEVNAPLNDFNKKYMPMLQLVFKNLKGNVTIPIIIDSLKNRGAAFSPDEQKLIHALIYNDSTPIAAKRRSLSANLNNDSVNAFHNRHNAFVNKYFKEKQKNSRAENLKAKLGINAGLASEIMQSQDLLSSVATQLTPFEDEELAENKKLLTIPFLVDYLSICNNNAKALIEKNKTKSGYTVNEAPKTEADKLFDKIMEKYKGKVVYVDFWATWCGPCRSVIEKMKPLKEEMAGKDVAFVYITNPSSPEKTWQNMIPDIKGEHYRVSQDEWNVLSSKFNISGIPHCVLVDKQGVVQNAHLNAWDEQAVKRDIEKFMQ